eukprot:gene2932-biopygen8230
MPGGMPPGMAEAMADPEVQEMMQDPEVQAAMAAMQSNPMAAMQYMSNPKVAAVLQKLMPGLAGMMGGKAFGEPPLASLGGEPLASLGEPGLTGEPRLTGMLFCKRTVALKCPCACPLRASHSNVCPYVRPPH